MNKKELAAGIAEKCEMTQNDAAAALDAMLDLISDSLKSGDEVRLLGFGNFSVTERAATTGRNPKTGEPIQIAASKQAKFKPGKQLKDTLNS